MLPKQIPNPIPKSLRGRLVHGWAFLELSDNHIASIRAFLQDGDIEHIPSYKDIAYATWAGVLEFGTKVQQKAILKELS